MEKDFVLSSIRRSIDVPFVPTAVSTSSCFVYSSFNFNAHQNCWLKTAHQVYVDRAWTKKSVDVVGLKKPGCASTEHLNNVIALVEISWTKIDFFLD